MTTTNEFGYDHVFELARQLSPEEREKLAQSLLAGKARPFESEPKMTEEEYYEFLMNFPVISEEEIRLMEEAKKTVDQCQPISP